jgi:septal ring factor EnvC (AmiA/AmiB activator)
VNSHSPCTSAISTPLNFVGIMNDVVMQVRDRILTPDNMCELTRLVNEELRAGSRTAESRLEATRSELANLNRRLDKHCEALETGALSISYSSKRIRALKIQIDEMKSSEFNLLEELDVAEDLRRTLAKGDVQQSKLFLASFIDKACVDEHKVEIHYGLPTRSGTSE